MEAKSSSCSARADVMADQALIEAVRAGLRRRADPVKAEGMRAYMKSQMPYLGVQSTPLREAMAEVLPRFPLASFEEWRATILALWHEAQFREERYAALGLVGDRRYRAFQTPESVPLYEQLIVSGAWWDLVDGIATHQIGDLLRRFPEQLRPIVLAWSQVDDHWLRRTSIICQVGFKAATDEELLFACIEPSLGERDFFLRKGIGWALREYSKTAPESVVRYVRANEQRLSLLSRREALRRLPADLQSGFASG
jgi:3-methyladenine DNA glycosylase AlkD